jgi:hypothetical protein
MEITGITRLRDGKEVDEFVVGCAEHNFWYRGKPPITHGCRECWHAFFYAQWALAGGGQDKLEQLESAIRHMGEAIDRGEFDFKPKLEDFQITHED